MESLSESLYLNALYRYILDSLISIGDIVPSELFEALSTWRLYSVMMSSDDQQQSKIRELQTQPAYEATEKWFGRKLEDSDEVWRNILAVGLQVPYDR